MIPVAILCGGHGTRSKQPINKCFVSVNGKPFILRVMEQLEDYGFSTFVLCRGTSGTLTALRNARDQLGERFLVLYGDTYLPMNYMKFINAWDQSGLPSITATIMSIDAGVNGFSAWMLDLLDENETDLSVLQHELQNRCLTYHYLAPHPWLEVGTPEALAKTKATLT